MSATRHLQIAFRYRHDYNLQRTSGVTIGIQYSLLGVIEKVGAEYARYMIYMIQVQDI